MIKFSFKKLPVDADGKAYDSLEAFQAAEIKKLVPILNIDTCAQIVEQKEGVLEILELTMDARPAARGVKKPRKPKGDSIQSLGGFARDASLSDERKTEIARNAENKRWREKNPNTGVA